MTVAELIAFEAAIAEDFNAGLIRAPVHLSGGNEHQLVEYFQQNYDFSRGDWIFTNWRSHYHCLLAGVSPQRLKADILAGRSITLTYPDHRILSSAIVGGTLPIALGTALSIKRQNTEARVHVFVGDMTGRTGIMWECLKYAVGHDLPIHFVIEDNGKSVMTPTDKVWGNNIGVLILPPPFHPFLTYYQYALPWPHAGAGKRVMF